MVRFIIYKWFKESDYLWNIYIPIWLDLLFDKIKKMFENIINLHSNMVRFIIFEEYTSKRDKVRFTFQYG